jgi:hypothetical protein
MTASGIEPLNFSSLLAIRDAEVADAAALAFVH